MGDNNQGVISFQLDSDLRDVLLVFNEDVDIHVFRERVLDFAAVLGYTAQSIEQAFPESRNGDDGFQCVSFDASSVCLPQDPAKAYAPQHSYEFSRGY